MILADDVHAKRLVVLKDRSGRKILSPLWMKEQVLHCARSTVN